MAEVREGCGTVAGVLAHQAAGEAACGFCVRAEKIAAIEAEGLPSGLPPLPPVAPAADMTPVGTYKPVTPRQATEHQAALLRELDDLAGSGRLRLVAS